MGIAAGPLYTGNWTNTLFSPVPEGSTSVESLLGTGGVETIYLDAAPGNTGYYRPVMELETP